MAPDMSVKPYAFSLLLPASSKVPPLDTIALPLPPAFAVSRPPLLTVANAVPPDSTTPVPPLLTIVALAVPPDSTC